MASHKVETDLPDGAHRLIIVQPVATKGIETTFALGKLSEVTFERILRETTSLKNLTHFGTIDYGIMPLNRTEKLIGVDRYLPCGGEISFSVKDESIKPIVCSHCGTNIRFAPEINFSSIRQMLFFLAFKQMFPRRRSCNFINFSFDLTVGQDLFKGNNPLLDRVSVAYDILATDNRLVAGNLGFTLTPGGIGLEEGFGGLDKWVETLVYKWDEMITMAINNSKMSVLGPARVAQR